MDDVVEALRAQVEELRAMVVPLDEAGLARPSACAGWSISDVLLHLAQTNEIAAASARGDFEAATEHWRSLPQVGDVDELAGAAVEGERGATGVAVRDRWARSADDMVAGFAECDPRARVPWVVGEMGARTLATTRIAEGWIHTGDVADGLGIERLPSDRIWHIARLVHRTLPYAFTRAGKDAPGPVRFELTAAEDPEERWVFGDDAPTVVTGAAVDVCRVAGQRASAAGTSLQARGPGGADVLALMRTFA